MVYESSDTSYHRVDDEQSSRLCAKEHKACRPGGQSVLSSEIASRRPEQLYSRSLSRHSQNYDSDHFRFGFSCWLTCGAQTTTSRCVSGCLARRA